MSKMSSQRVEDTMNRLFQSSIPLSAAQHQRLARASSALTLARTVQLPLMANWLSCQSQKAGRVRFLERFFEAEFLSQELVYQPFLAHCLAKRQDEVWYLLIDRSTLRGYETEILVISLAYNGHAIPLVWQVIDFGCTGALEQIALWKRLSKLLERILPQGTRIVVQGDSEFGSVDVIRFLRQQAWDFILAQAANSNYRQRGTQVWQSLSDLPLKAGRGIYLENIEWTEKHIYGAFNLFAFWQEHQSSPESKRREARYCLTSLRMSHMLRPLGRRRWGIECFFKDYKSGGFDVESSHFRSHERWEKLLVLLSVNYLWFNVVGRWLSKVGKRALVDAKARRQLSFFRIGWDWLISEFSQGRSWPTILTLYS
jgi:hypothetical protein